MDTMIAFFAGFIICHFMWIIVEKIILKTK